MELLAAGRLRWRLARLKTSAGAGRTGGTGGGLGGLPRGCDDERRGAGRQASDGIRGGLWRTPLRRRPPSAASGSRGVVRLRRRTAGSPVVVRRRRPMSGSAGSWPSRRSAISDQASAMSAIRPARCHADVAESYRRIRWGDRWRRSPRPVTKSCAACRAVRSSTRADTTTRSSAELGGSSTANRSSTRASRLPPWRPSSLTFWARASGAVRSWWSATGSWLNRRSPGTHKKGRSTSPRLPRAELSFRARHPSRVLLLSRRRRDAGRGHAQSLCVAAGPEADRLRAVPRPGRLARCAGPASVPRASTRRS